MRNRTADACWPIFARAARPKNPTTALSRSPKLQDGSLRADTAKIRSLAQCWTLSVAAERPAWWRFISDAVSSASNSIPIMLNWRAGVLLKIAGFGTKLKTGIRREGGLYERIDVDDHSGGCRAAALQHQDGV